LLPQAKERTKTLQREKEREREREREMFRLIRNLLRARAFALDELSKTKLTASSHISTSPASVPTTVRGPCHPLSSQQLSDLQDSG
jgi:hypothetical protein